MNKICFVVPRYDPTIGGTEFLCKQILESLNIDEFDISIITTPNQNRIKNNYNYKIYECPFGHFSLMKDHFEIFNYDLCIFFADLHDNFLNSYDFRWNKKNICVLNLDERTYESQNNFLIAKNNLINFDLVITFTKDGVANKFLNSNNIKNVYIPNFSRDILQTKIETDYILKLGLDKTKKTILYNAAFEERKNQLLIIDYINKSNNLKNYNWIFIGAVADEKYLTNCILLNKNNKNVVFLKGTPNTKIIDQLYQQSDCVMLLSIAEGLPLVLLEALSANKPFIATPVGGVSGVMKNICTQYILENVYNNIDVIEKKLITVLNSKTNNRKIWLDYFNKDDIIEEYKKIIRDFVK